MNPRTDYLPLSLLAANVIGLVPSALAYQYAVMPLIPDAVHYDLWSAIFPPGDGWSALVWQHDRVIARISWTWPHLIQAHYDAYFTLSLLASVLAGGGWVAVSRRQPHSLLYAVLGWLGGAGVGWLVTQATELPTLWGLIAMPGGAVFGGYLTLLFTAPPVPEIEVRIKRGTRIVPVRTDTRRAVAAGLRQGRACLAGQLLPVEAEVRSVLLLGASGSGKSVAITALMRTIFGRGDRAIAADPDGTAMGRFWRPGDIILNPLDARSVRWDLLAEIQKTSDYKHLAESILPFTGDSRVDEWRTHSQLIFAACLQTWSEGQLGSSDRFLTTLAKGGDGKLKLLCQGTAAAGYFSEGGEKMLNSILNTLRPALTDLEALVGGKGPLFSVRRWLREGTGTLWIPYGAGQITALRGPVSCWMRLAIFELLEMSDSETRRVWFFLDELDALGRIEGLANAMVRARKKGGCTVAGIQSIAQVRMIYKDEASTIVEQFGTQLLLKCGASEGGGTARFASDLIGEREVERIDVSTSHNPGHSTPSTSRSPRLHVEKAVLPAEITQLPDLSGYLRIAGRPEWLKVAFRPIAVKKCTIPAEPIEAEKDTSLSKPIDVQEEANSPGQTVKPPLLSADGYPRMSFPFAPERLMYFTAELFCKEHPALPRLYIEGEPEELLRQRTAYDNAWDKIWSDFQTWWLNAPEEERYKKVVAAAQRYGLDLAGFDHIPEDDWREMQDLRFVEGNRPFLNV